MKKTFFSNAFLFTFLALIISSFSIMEAEARRGKTVGKKPLKNARFIPIESLINLKLFSKDIMTCY